LHPPYQWSSLGYPLYVAGRYAEAVEALRKVPEPWIEPRLVLALALAQAGESEAARAEAAEVLRLDPAFSVETWIANDFYQPGGSSALRFVEGAAKAGLPVCAVSPDGVAAADRLPECDEGRTGRPEGALP
jgi:adenylate cyclase